LEIFSSPRLAKQISSTAVLEVKIAAKSRPPKARWGSDRVIANECW
jgi:hypothetical protein